MVIDVSRLQAKEKLKPGVRLAVHWPPGVIRQDRGVLSPTRVDCFSGHCNGCRLGLIWYAGYGGGRWWEAERRGLYYKLTKWGLSGGRRHWERERGEVDKYLPIFFRLCSTQCLPMDAGSVVVRKEKKLTPVTRRPHDSEKVRRRWIVRGRYTDGRKMWLCVCVFAETLLTSH